ncbi:TPA: 50S ribosomal protein L5 [candidate division WOR-3 bacterium]|jgi:large subunit ribosomal protein L5|uniref:Large ribosomal subunit protein uL5 n=1 Tax=candidate division WOR-3 bacterium TaxID=2052148 RepID=A0A350H7Q6_UNCW3|nr:50S ribosomal protein L5 [candidate division WOR-3 bacterium]
MSETKKLYDEKVRKELLKELKLKNINEVPKLQKIVISMGLGKALQDKAILDEAVKDISAITGQRPVITEAKKSISNFKLRKGVKVGLKLTLRREMMYEFVDRFFNVAIPRIRDFRGINSDSFDGNGNFNMGITDHVIFPEIEYDKIKYPFGMNITFVIKSKNDQHSFALLKKLGMPFKK